MSKMDSCSRCGKTVVSASRGVTTATRFKFEQTGEVFCAECAMEVIGEIVPDDSGPAANAFLADTIGKITLRADIDPVLVTARCKTVVASDVEIRRTARGYDVTLHSLLVLDPDRTRRVIDYVVGWIAENPFQVRALTTKQVGPQQLGLEGLVVFLFIPASRPIPTDDEIEDLTRQIAPKLDPSKVGWRVLVQPHDSGAENHEFITNALQAWSSEQGDVAGIEVAPKPVRTQAGRELVCLVASRATRS